MIAFTVIRNFIGSWDFKNKNIDLLVKMFGRWPGFVLGCCLLVCSLLRIWLWVLFFVNYWKKYLLIAVFYSCAFWFVFHFVRTKLVWSKFYAFFLSTKYTCWCCCIQRLRVCFCLPVLLSLRVYIYVLICSFWRCCLFFFAVLFYSFCWLQLFIICCCRISAHKVPRFTQFSHVFFRFFLAFRRRDVSAACCVAFFLCSCSLFLFFPLF